MRKGIKLIILLALVSALAAAAPRGLWAPGEDGRLEGVPGIINARTQGGYGWRDVNTSTLGQDLIAGEYWTPTVDFSGGTKYYFDPNATVKGDGSIDSPFRALGVEVASDSTIIRIGVSSDTLSASTAVVGGGDVCVLLPGNHGWIRFLEYYNSDYIALAGVPSGGATFDYLNFEEYTNFYVKDFDYSQKARYLRADAGTMTDAGYDSKPSMLNARRDSNGNGVAENLIIQDCDFSTGTAAQAAAWSETEWDSIVCDAMIIRTARNVHVQDCTGAAVGNAFGIEGSGSFDGVAYNILNNSFQWLNADAFRVSYMDSLHISGNFMRDFIITNDDHVDGMQVWAQSDNILFEKNQMWETTDASRTAYDFGINTYYTLISSIAEGAFDNSIVRNNILYGATWAGVRANAPDGLTIVNNTVIGRDEGGTASAPYIRFQGVPVSSVIANNICSATQDTSGAGTITNNLTYTRDWTSAGFVTYTNDGDPTLWDLRLSATSPAIRAGSSTYAPGADYAGASRPDRVFDDVGAYVYDDPDVTAPAQITAALDYRNASSLQISWVDPVATDAWYCTVYRGTASGSLDSVAVASMGDEVYYDDTIDSGTDYYFAVTCTDSSGNESAQREVFAEADATAPAAVSDLLVTNYFDQVDLTWSDPAAADLDYINLYRDQVDGSTLFDVVAKGTEGYSDTTVNTDGDSTYYYRVAAVDSSGNVSTLSNQTSATPEVTPLAWNAFTSTTPTLADTTSGGNAEMTVTARVNSAAFIRPLFRRHDGAYTDWTDTTGMAWMTADSAQLVWDGAYDTGVPVAVALEDSGGIRLTWDAATGHDGYRLQMDANGAGWLTVTHPHPDSTGFTHAADDDTLPPSRGELNYRLFSFTGTPGSETSTSAVALADSLYYNQSVRVYSQFHAIADTQADFSNIAVSDEDSEIWISRPSNGDSFDRPGSYLFAAGTTAVDTTSYDYYIAGQEHHVFPANTTENACDGSDGYSAAGLADIVGNDYFPLASDLAYTNRNQIFHQYFPAVGDSLAGATIDSAFIYFRTLHTVDWSASGDTLYVVSSDDSVVGESIDGTSANANFIYADCPATTWSNNPFEINGVGGLSGEVSVFRQSVTLGNWYRADVTDGVQAWADGSGNYGFLFFGVSDNTDGIRMSVSSADYSTAAYRMYLEVWASE